MQTHAQTSPIGHTYTSHCNNASARQDAQAGDFRRVAREDWICTVDANMLTPIFLIRAVVDGMVARGFGPIINITASGVKSPGIYPQLGIAIGVRSELTGFIGVLSG